MRRRDLLALLLVPACSWALVEQPPRYDAGTRPLACTASLATPIADTALAVVFAGAATTLLISARTGDAKLELGLGIAAGLAAVPYGFSAGYGYAQTGRCRGLGRIVRPGHAPH